MATNSSMLHIRIDDDLKRQATATLKSVGLSTSEAIRLFFYRVVAERAFPLELKVPNAETRAAMREAEAIVREKRARFATADELFASLDKESGL